MTHVCASRSQASLKDLVLDKGDAVYRQARERFPNSVHLASDELPDEVSARRSKYQVDSAVGVWNIWRWREASQP